MLAHLPGYGVIDSEDEEPAVVGSVSSGPPSTISIIGSDISDVHAVR